MPVVVGDLPPAAVTVIDRVARERGAEVVRTAPLDVQGFTIGLRGSPSDVECGRRRQAARHRGPAGDRRSAPAVAHGLERPGWPGRLERRVLSGGREVLLDAAHNPAGAAALASYLRAQAGGPRPLVFGAMRDKDASGMFAALLPAVSHLILTRASTERSAEPSDPGSAGARDAVICR